MSTRELPYSNNPFAHLAFLVSDALRRPATRAKAPATRRWPERLERWLWSRRQREVEAYLAQSQDLAELERRMRELDRHIASRSY